MCTFLKLNFKRMGHGLSTVPRWAQVSVASEEGEEGAVSELLKPRLGLSSHLMDTGEDGP